MNGTQRTYNARQIEERGKEVAMEASEKLLAALRTTGPAASNERIDSLANAVVAGTGMIEAASNGDAEPT